MKPTFSQRQGIKPLNDALQIKVMSRDLRNALWNVIWINFFHGHGFNSLTLQDTNFDEFCFDYWVSYSKEPIDMAPDDEDEYLSLIRRSYFQGEWNEAYDLIEYLANYSQYLCDPIYMQLNEALDRERSGYRFVSNVLTPITTESEAQAVEEVLSVDFGHNSVSAHIQRALELFSDINNPDYRNSIKESISAVECMAKIVTNKPKASLEDALKVLEKEEKLHKALRDGFGKLYAYTNDANGIRHSLLEDSNLTAADAKYFLLSCTSFVNYLKSKM